MQEGTHKQLVAPRRAIKFIAVSLICGCFALSGKAQQVSIWNASAIPGTITDSDPSAVELGVKFQSSAAGAVAGVRFYKGPNNTGTHVGHLWSDTGTLLASVTFKNETASGWQQANFSTSVAIQPNTTYVVSYYCPNGHYSADNSYFRSAVNSSPLTALQSGTDGPNGVYIYGKDSFPTQSWDSSNYWVDLAFVPSGSGSPTPADSIWTASTVPGTITNSDAGSVELGVKFRSSVAGAVSGVRFYKGPSNTGTHVGHLWSKAGALLASVSFKNETGSGWQQASFSTPVAIQPNTTYVVSYYCPNGYYSGDNGYFQSAVNHSPLTALQSGTDGPNGVYVYGKSSFPTQSWAASNYWVDLTFVPSGTSGGSPGSGSSGSGGSSTYTISGSVKGSPATLTLSGAASSSATTNASGGYSFSGLANGSYVVAPSESGYTFMPSTASVAINGASVASVNFTATTVPVGVQHNVTLTWAASISPNIIGYNVYRGATSGGPYTKIGGIVSGTSYLDNTVSSGQTYYYVATAVDSGNVESGYSNQTVATVPTP